MRYRILGVTQAEDDHGTAVPIGGPRLRALLTALALRTDRTTTPETLITEVWADTPPKDAGPARCRTARGGLGAERYESERTTGSALTADDVLDLLDELAHRHTPPTTP